MVNLNRSFCCSLTIGQHSEGEDFTVTKWFKVPCFSLPRHLKKKGITVESFLQDHVKDESTDCVLSDQSMLDKIAEQIATNIKSTDSKKEGDGGVVDDPSKALIANLKRNAKVLLEEDGKEEDNGRGPVKKKSKSSSVLSTKDHVYASAYLEYSTLKVDELKDFLRWNYQIVTGNRSTILYRVVDGRVNGRLGFCSLCVKGRLKLSDDAAFATCSGYYDDDMSSKVTCFNKIDISKAQRLQPWLESEPSSAEIEEMKNASGKMKGERRSAVPDTLAATAEELNWDLSNPKGMKQAAKELATLCSSTVDLPASDSTARMEIGKLILSNKGKSAKDVLRFVIDKFGLKEAKAVAAKEKSKARSFMCNHLSNAPILEVMLELSELYFKEKNTNAGITYKKVAQAIKETDFEINEDNAKGLGKGKTKVAGIGKGSADKIYEFVTTGKIEKLEEKRAALA